MDEARRRPVGIGDTPSDTRVGPSIDVPAVDNEANTIELLREIMALPLINYTKDLKPGERRIFVGSIMEAGKLDLDDVTDYHLSLPADEQRQIILAQRYGGGVDLAEYMYLRQNSMGQTDHRQALGLSREAARLRALGPILPWQ